MEILGISAAVAAIVWAVLWSRVRMHQSATACDDRTRITVLEGDWRIMLDTMRSFSVQLDELRKAPAPAFDYDAWFPLITAKLEARLKQADLVPELAREFATIKSAIALKQSFGK